MMPRSRFLLAKFFSPREEAVGRGVFCLRLAVAFLVCLIFSTSVFSADLSVEEIVNNIQANQAKIKDMSADTITTITSTMKGMEKMVQKGKILTKSPDKSRIEISSPMRQITITNGDMVKVVNPDTGQSFVQDMKKLREKSGGQTVGQSGSQVSLDKAREYFDLSVKQPDSGEYIITGVPKKANQFLGRMEFYVDSERWVPTKIVMYNVSGKILSSSILDYEEIAEIWISTKNVTNVALPTGNMKTEIIFENIKVNQGIKDEYFKI